MIRVEPLTAEAFAPFGDVIEVDPSRAFDINDGFTTRNHALARVQSQAGAILSIFEGRVRPLSVAMVECHPLGSQAFVPLNGQDWLAVVAGTPEPAACRAFLCKGAQGLQYNAGVWHHPLLVLGGAQNFLVVDRDGKNDQDNRANLREVFFDKPLEIML